ncbi:unnamed protein product [Soboliphyme baturini]|uniref:Uncharacterized protein n=1 Tax=Soboliphyme baturini TaxID=241478 RepID=A0A183IUK4_9BILA|nr:unnamed protein product [Soboliphyme baturini]
MKLFDEPCRIILHCPRRRSSVGYRLTGTLRPGLRSLFNKLNWRLHCLCTGHDRAPTEDPVLLQEDFRTIGFQVNLSNSKWMRMLSIVSMEMAKNSKKSTASRQLDCKNLLDGKMCRKTKAASASFNCIKTSLLEIALPYIVYDSSASKAEENKLMATQGPMKGKYARYPSEVTF